MFWCYSCEKVTQSTQISSCQFCSSEAIEQINEQNHPEVFRPYQSQPQPDENQPNNVQSNPFESMMNQSMMIGYPGNMINMFSSMLSDSMPNGMPMFIRYTTQRPLIRMFIISNDEEEKSPVTEQKINLLEKVQLKQECAICQQSQGNGLKLPCNHEFHEHCIRPWFQQKNTCPCCRIAL